MAYSLALSALELPLKQIKGTGDQRQEEDITLGKLLKDIEGQEFQIDDQLTAIDVTTETGSLALRGPNFNLKLANTILELRKEGIKPLAAKWFWWDKDDSSSDPVISYVFFVVHDEEDKIVREEVRFLDYPGSGFDPAVFESIDSPPFWSSEPRWDLAWAAYWYRRFYKETKVGQLMVLRPDVPVLYYYPEGRPWYKRRILQWEVRVLLFLFGVGALLALLF
ncbi:hypothetical protein [Edaphobacter bradus]|uniref:hypothetical protein n=1 Tax=Edaphobacter bradus TaxID=2259016 RepID=UPI0021E0FA47|nr:hypothetical protein [Edaphobacter bradus]